LTGIMLSGALIRRTTPGEAHNAGAGMLRTKSVETGKALKFYVIPVLARSLL